jgi:nicotinate phosphoribosyltransferase
VVFSDSLDIDTIVSLHKAFKDKINVLFGWGTSLTNDLGFKALNIVAKATYVEVPEAEEGVYTVKLSDDAGKHTGPPEQVKTYQENDNYFAIAA